MNGLAEANSNWRGDAVTYKAVHLRLRAQRGKASEHACEACGEPAVEWAFDEPTGYSTDLSRYRALCHPCHRLGTHCPKGHEYTPENTAISKTTGTRRCRTCGREQTRQYRLARRAGIA